MNNEGILSCAVCKQTSHEIPVLALEFDGKRYGICPTDFPLLIHQPQKLIGVIPGAEKLQPHEH